MHDFAMVYSTYVQQRIVVHHTQGYKAPSILRLLCEEKLKATKWGIYCLLCKLEQTGTIKHKAGSGRLSKITAGVKAIVENQKVSDDETMATQLCILLKSRGYSIDLRTVLRCRSQLGWTHLEECHV